MNATWIPIMLVLLLFFWQQKQRQQAVIAKIILSKNHKEERTVMLDVAKNFVNKECLIYTVNSSSPITGTIQAVSQNAILLLDAEGATEAINLEFVTRIREYPRKKNGKKKSLVLD